MNDATSPSKTIWLWTAAGIVLYLAPFWLVAVERAFEIKLAVLTFLTTDSNLIWFHGTTPAWFFLGVGLASRAMRKKRRFAGFALSVNLVLFLLTGTVGAILLFFHFFPLRMH